MASSSPGLMSCFLIVDTESLGWHKSMTKLLNCVRDGSYTFDAQMGYAHVSGKIATVVLPKMVAKIQKHAVQDRIDYGWDGYWDHLHKPHESQEHASRESDSAEPAEAKPAQAPVLAPNTEHKSKKPICCTVM